jgi:hypothetical protein
MKAKDKLVEALTRAGASQTMVEAAAQGRYDDFESHFPTPLMDLVYDCRVAGLDDIAHRAMEGEFDATRGNE